MLFRSGKWGVGAVKNSSLTQSLNECGNSALVTDAKSASSPHLAQHSNLAQDTRILESYNTERLEANKDMPQGGEVQGVDSAQGAGVWNMEQNDPDPFMRELNIQGLPYVVLEIESNGETKVLEDGRKS